MPARVLSQIIRRTTFATDNESSRYALGGVLIELTADKITAVGTDGRRLAMMEAPAQSVGGHATGDNMTIVPARSMHLIEKILTEPDAEIHIAARANEMLVKSPRATLYSRLVEGRFPKWRDVFPKRPDAVQDRTVGRPAALGRAAGRDRHQRRKPRRRFHVRRGKVGPGRPAHRSWGNRASNCRWPTTARPCRSASTRDSSTIFSKCSSPKQTFTLELKDAESAAVCHTDDGYSYVIMPLARDR